MPVQCQHDPVFGNAQLAGRAFQNAAIGLMWHKPVNVAWREAGLLYDLFHDGGNVDDGVLEHLAAFHAQVPHGFGG